MPETEYWKYGKPVQAHFVPLHRKWSFPLRISSHVLKKSFMENFILSAMKTPGDTLWDYLITCIPLAIFSKLFQRHIFIYLSIHKERSIKECCNISKVFNRGVRNVIVVVGRWRGWASMSNIMFGQRRKHLKYLKYLKTPKIASKCVSNY